jgi:hypothetical protein
MKIIVPHCEWDIGLSPAYRTEEGFKKDAIELLKSSGIEETYEECFADGLIGFDEEELGA